MEFAESWMAGDKLLRGDRLGIVMLRNGVGEEASQVGGCAVWWMRSFESRRTRLSG